MKIEVDENLSQSKTSSPSFSLRSGQNCEWPEDGSKFNLNECIDSKDKSLGASSMNDDTDSVSNEAQSGVINSAHITQKDAFLVFRSLCRLAIKDCLGPNSLDPKSHSIRSKTLSLQLLLNLFQQPGPLFCSSEIFIAAIKQYLCVALYKNGTAPVGVEVFDLTVAIFLALMTHFKSHLKFQMEIFFKDVLFAVLDSNKSIFEHKLIVIDALKRVCANAQCLVDIYLNYDCDLNMTNIFEKLTTSLSKIAQGPSLADHSSSSTNISQHQQQQQQLQSHSLECLVFILKCMTDWSNDLYLNPESQSFLGPDHNLNDVSTTGLGSMGIVDQTDFSG